MVVLFFCFWSLCSFLSSSCLGRFCATNWGYSHFTRYVWMVFLCSKVFHWLVDVKLLWEEVVLFLSKLLLFLHFFCFCVCLFLLGYIIEGRAYYLTSLYYSLHCLFACGFFFFLACLAAEIERIVWLWFLFFGIFVWFVCFLWLRQLLTRCFTF